MKKCVRCRIEYPDSQIKCPKCDLYLVEDFSSELVFTSRPQVHYDPLPEPEASTYTNTSASHENRPPKSLSDFQPGKRGNDQRSDIQHGSPDRPSVQPGRSTRIPFYVRCWPILRRLLPTILIVLVFFLIVSNWEGISEVLSVAFVGAVIGGIAGFFLISRSQHATSGILWSCMFVGAVLTCMFSYNLLGIQNSMTDIFESLLYIAILGYGISMILSSLRR